MRDKVIRNLPKKISKLHDKVMKLEKHLMKLESDQNSLAHYGKRNNFVLTGIPEIVK